MLYEVITLLGSGPRTALTGAVLEHVEFLNLLAAPVLAVDVPTGLQADSGCRLGAAVNRITSYNVCYTKLLRNGPASAAASRPVRRETACLGRQYWAAILRESISFILSNSVVASQRG